jgi:hypothetical protein
VPQQKQQGCASNARVPPSYTELVLVTSIQRVGRRVEHAQMRASGAGGRRPPSAVARAANGVANLPAAWHMRQHALGHATQLVVADRGTRIRAIPCGGLLVSSAPHSNALESHCVLSGTALPTLRPRSKFQLPVLASALLARATAACWHLTSIHSSPMSPGKKYYVAAIVTHRSRPPSLRQLVGDTSA